MAGFSLRAGVMAEAQQRVNLTRFHGVFGAKRQAPYSSDTAKRGKKTAKAEPGGTDWLDMSPEERNRAMTRFCSMQSRYAFRPWK